jgi:hypothetical protein
MSLSAFEQHELQCIENSLADSDPRLASLLATFTRLTAGEEMPARERIQAGRRLGPGRRRRRRPRPGARGAAIARPPRRVAWRRIGPVLWVLLAIGLIAGALAATGGGGRACNGSTAVCAGLAPVRPPADPGRPVGGPLAIGAGGSPRLLAGRQPS